MLALGHRVGDLIHIGSVLVRCISRPGVSVAPYCRFAAWPAENKVGSREHKYHERFSQFLFGPAIGQQFLHSRVHVIVHLCCSLFSCHFPLSLTVSRTCGFSGVCHHRHRHRHRHRRLKQSKGEKEAA